MIFLNGSATKTCVHGCANRKNSQHTSGFGFRAVLLESDFRFIPMSTINHGSKPTLIRQVIDPLQRFMQLQASSGIVLLLAVVAALVWANSAYSTAYFDLWMTPVDLRVGTWSFSHDPSHPANLLFLINDGLMA